MKPDPDLLPPDIAGALEAVGGALLAAGVPFALGGSALVRLLGGTCDVGDVDLLVAADTRNAVEAALGSWSVEVTEGGAEPWHSAWIARCPGGPGGPGSAVDVIGGMAVRLDGVVTPITGTVGEVEVGGVAVGLSDPVAWARIYRMLNPDKARALERAVAAGRTPPDPLP